MRSTTELCMEAWLRTASITPTQPLELGDNRKRASSILYILYAYMCHFSSMLVQDSVLVRAARGNPKGKTQQDVVHVLACSMVG